MVDYLKLLEPPNKLDPPKSKLDPPNPSAQEVLYDQPAPESSVQVFNTDKAWDSEDVRDEVQSITNVFGEGYSRTLFGDRLVSDILGQPEGARYHTYIDEVGKPHVELLSKNKGKTMWKDVPGSKKDASGRWHRPEPKSFLGKADEWTLGAARIKDLLNVIVNDQADPEDRIAAVKEIDSELMYFTPLMANALGKTVGEMVKPITMAIRKGVPGRFIAKGINRMLPEQLQHDTIGEHLWEMVAVPRWKNPLSWPLAPAVGAVKGKFIPTPEIRQMGLKSLSDIFQPAVERMAPAAAKAFRQGQVNKALMAQVGEFAGLRLERMKPVDQLDFVGGLMGKKVKGEDAKKLMKEMSEMFKEAAIPRDVMDDWAKAFKGTINRDLTIDALDDDFMRPVLDDFLEKAFDTMSSKTKKRIWQSKPMYMRKILNNIIDSPGTGKTMRGIAIDLYDVGAKTPKAVAEAAKSASIKKMEGDLIESGMVKIGLDPEDVPKDWVQTKYKAFEDSWVPRDVEMELKALEQIPKIAHGNFNKIMSIWKIGKTVMRPATHVRNIFSNVILNDWGGLSAMQMANPKGPYWQAVKQIRSNGKLWKEWQRLTGQTGTFSINDVAQFSEGVKYNANPFEMALSGIDRVTAKPKHLYNMEEQWFKMAKYIDNLEKGLDTEQAALDAMKWTFNYGEVTRATARLRSTITPFATWTSKVLPMMTETAVKHPLRFGKWIVMYNLMQQQALDGLGITDREFEYINYILPDYIRDSQFLMLPWRDQQDRLQLLNLTYMIPGMGDVAEIAGDPAQALFASPLLGIGGTFINKTKFSGAPLYYDWESNDVKAGKMFNMVWQQLMPSWVPGGQDAIYTKLWDAYNENPDFLSYEQIIGQQFGLKITPIDQKKAKRRRRVLEDIHLSQVDSRMRSELRKTKDRRKREKIRDKYNRYRREILNERPKR